MMNWFASFAFGVSTDHARFDFWSIFNFQMLRFQRCGPIGFVAVLWKKPQQVWLQVQWKSTFQFLQKSREMTSRHLKWSGEDWENRAGRQQRQVRHHQVSIFQESFLMVHTKFEFEQQAQEAQPCTQHHFDALFERFVSACWSPVNFSAFCEVFFFQRIISRIVLLSN